MKIYYFVVGIQLLLQHSNKTPSMLNSPTKLQEQINISTTHSPFKIYTVDKNESKIRFLYSTTEFYCIIWNGYPEIGLLKVESDLGRRNIPRFSSTLTKHRNRYEYRKNKQQWEFQEMQRPELEARRSHKGGGLNFYSVFIWQKIILFCLNCEIFRGWESKRKKKMAKPKAKQTATAWGGDPTLVWLDVDDQIVLLLYFYHIILFLLSSPIRFSQTNNWFCEV